MEHRCSKITAFQTCNVCYANGKSLKSLDFVGFAADCMFLHTYKMKWFLLSAIAGFRRAKTKLNYFSQQQCGLAGYLEFFFSFGQSDCDSVFAARLPASLSPRWRGRKKGKMKTQREVRYECLSGYVQGEAGLYSIGDITSIGEVQYITEVEPGDYIDGAGTIHKNKPIHAGPTTYSVLMAHYKEKYRYLVEKGGI